jgi:hypothetical protein
MLGNARFSLPPKPGSKWSVVRKKKSSLARLAAFDRAAKRVHEVSTEPAIHDTAFHRSFTPFAGAPF